VRTRSRERILASSTIRRRLPRFTKLRAGGLRRSRPAAVLPRHTPDHPLRNTTEVSAFLSKSINDVLRGALDPRVANSAGYLANILLRSLEQGPLEERLARLESTLGIAKDPHIGTSGKDSLPV
jgi:hypothetical protein